MKKSIITCIIIYLLSALLTWHGVRNRYVRYDTDNNPEFSDMVEVFMPIYNTVFGMFVIAEKLAEWIDPHIPDPNKFFDIEKR